jgi:hypothetical protein
MYDAITLNDLHDKLMAQRRQAAAEKARERLKAKGGRQKAKGERRKADQRSLREGGRENLPAGKAGANRPKRPRPERLPARASLDVFDDAIVLTRYGGGKKMTRCFVSQAEVADLFTGAASQEFSWMATAGSLVLRICGTRQHWLIHRPAGPAMIRLRTGPSGTIRVRLPGLIAEMESVRKKADGPLRWVKIGRVWSCYDERPTAASELRACPMPNSYEDGNWSHGSTSIDRDELEGKSALDVLDKGFISGIVNTGHSFNQALSDRGVKRYRTTLAMLRRCRRAAPPAWAMKKVTTLGELLAGRAKA